MTKPEEPREPNPDDAAAAPEWPIERYPLRTPDRAAMAARSSITTGLMVAALVLMGGTMLLGRQPGAVLWLAAVGAGTLAGILTARRARQEGEAVSLELYADRVRIPVAAGASAAYEAPYSAVRVAEPIGRETQSVLLLGLGEQQPTAFRDAAFEQPGAVREVAEGLRRRIRALPNGDEQLARMERRGRTARRLVTGSSWASQILVAVLVLVFVLQQLTGSLRDPIHLLVLGANSAPLVHDGEWTRLITGNLLHGSPIHILANGFALYLLGRLLEPLLGWARFLLVFFVACLAGAGLSAAIASHTVALGASTGAMGVFAVFVLLHWSRADEMPTVISWRSWILMAVYVLVPEFLIPNIDHAGHAGGFTGGLLTGYLLTRGHEVARLREHVSPALTAVAVAGCLLFTGVAGWRLGGATLHHDARSERMAMQLMRHDALPWRSLNNAAWHLATAEDTPTETLEVARDRLQQQIEAKEDPASAIRDTLATLHYRLGELDRAVELERELLAVEPSNELERHHRGTYAAQLARFEWKRLQRSGPMMPASLSEAPPTVRLEGVGPRASGLPSVTVDLAAGTLAEGGELHAVVVRDGEARALIRLRLGPDPARSHRHMLPEEVAEPLEAGAEARLTRVDPGAGELGAREATWEAFPMLPRVARLP